MMDKMDNLIETSSSWSALTLVLTTCAVLIYLILLLTSIFKGTRQVKSVLKIGTEEFIYETKEGHKFRFKHHKFFWICVAAAYTLAILLSIWFILFILVLLYLMVKLLVRRAKVKA